MPTSATSTRVTPPPAPTSSSASSANGSSPPKTSTTSRRSFEGGPRRRPREAKRPDPCLDGSGRFASRGRRLGLLAEPLPVLVRDDEGPDHLGPQQAVARRLLVAHVLAGQAERVELRQPEVVAREVLRRLGRVGRVAAEVAEVLHQHG